MQGSSWPWYRSHLETTKPATSHALTLDNPAARLSSFAAGEKRSSYSSPSSALDDHGTRRGWRMVRRAGGEWGKDGVGNVEEVASVTDDRVYTMRALDLQVNGLSGTMRIVGGRARGRRRCEGGLWTLEGGGLTKMLTFELRRCLKFDAAWGTDYETRHVSTIVPAHSSIALRSEAAPHCEYRRIIGGTLWNSDTARRKIGNDALGQLSVQLICLPFRPGKLPHAHAPPIRVVTLQSDSEHEDGDRGGDCDHLGGQPGAKQRWVE